MAEDHHSVLTDAEQLVRDIDAYVVTDPSYIRRQALRLRQLAEGLPPSEAERYRHMLLFFTQGGCIPDAARLNALVGSLDTFRAQCIEVVVAWSGRRLDDAIAAVRQAQALDPGDDAGTTAYLAWSHARLHFEAGQAARARELIDEAMDLDAPLDERRRIEVFAQVLGVTGERATRAQLWSLLEEPRGRYRATVRVSVLYQAVEVATRTLGSNEMRAFAAEAWRIARDTGLWPLVYKTTMAYADALRASARAEEALEALVPLEDLELPLALRTRVRSLRGWIHMQLGHVDEAHRDLAAGIEGAQLRGDELSTCNLMVVRAALWVYEERFDLARTALDQVTLSEGHASYRLLRVVLALAAGDDAAARQPFAELDAMWADLDQPPARATAHGLAAVVHGDRERLASARSAAVLAGPHIVAMVDACAWLYEGSQEPLAWRDALEAGEAPALLGSIAGVALAGLQKHRAGQASAGLRVLEPGVYWVDGTTVDLRRRHALRGIVETLRSDPTRTWEVADLYEACWDDAELPVTFADRLYFAIYELRRLGFRDHVKKSDDGYHWAR